MLVQKFYVLLLYFSAFQVSVESGLPCPNPGAVKGDFTSAFSVVSSLFDSLEVVGLCVGY